MLLTGGYGQKRRGSFDEAIEWAEILDGAVARWAPQFDEDDQRHARDWIGTGVVLAAKPGAPTDEQWTAVAIVERRAVLEDSEFDEFWKRSDSYMCEQKASFAALVTGPIEIAAGVIFGGSVRVPGGTGLGGTLGGAIDAGDDCVGLTAGHVVSAGPEGGIAEQSSIAAVGASTEIGQVIGWSKLRWRHNKADLGLIRLHPHLDNGERSAFADLGPAGLRELPVRKTGDATGTTVGRVTLINATKVGVRHGSRRRFFDGLFGIESEGRPFAWFGDSGALVFPENDAATGGAAVGMVVAVARAYGRSTQPVCFAVGSSAMSDRIDMFLRNNAWTEA
jgi:hypothetical protein